MAQTRAYYTAVATGEDLTGNASKGILDMLRYDVANVVEVHADYIVIRTPREVTTDRWRSFGIWVGASFEGSKDAARAIAHATGGYLNWQQSNRNLAEFIVARERGLDVGAEA